jgi:hypothetical protein
LKSELNSEHAGSTQGCLGAKQGDSALFYSVLLSMGSVLSIIVAVGVLHAYYVRRASVGDHHEQVSDTADAKSGT